MNHEAREPMATNTQLPHLIRLLDDDSDIVREQILHQLLSFGPTLEQELRQQGITLSTAQRQIIAGLFEQGDRAWIDERWASWFDVRDDKLKLEMALGLIAQYLHGMRRTVRLDLALDALAAEYRALHVDDDPALLAKFLFTTKGIRGAEESDYFNPMHTSLLHAIEERRGIPITLCSLFILVGHRLGLDVEGCNFPGHFLALTRSRGRRNVVDCYTGGLFLSERDFATLSPAGAVDFESIHRMECDAATIVGRCLRNLINAYRHRNDDARVEFMGELLARCERSESDASAEEDGEEG